MRYIEITEDSGLRQEVTWWMEPNGHIHYFTGDHDEVIGGLLDDGINPEYPWAEYINDPYREALATGWLMGRHVSDDFIGAEGDKKSIGKLLPQLLRLAKQEGVPNITLTAFPTKQWIDILKNVDTTKEAWYEFNKIENTYNDYISTRLEPGHIEKLKKWVSN